MLKIFIILFWISSNIVSLCLLLFPWLFLLFLTLLPYFSTSLLQSKTLSEIVKSIRIAVNVVKFSVTSVWGYELLHANRSIRVTALLEYLNLGNYSYTNYALKLHQNLIYCDSVIHSSFANNLPHWDVSSSMKQPPEYPSGAE